jgi:flagellar biosynthesis protein FlhF
MDVKTYRARSMSEALNLVRNDLGPDAAVLHTREVRGGLFRWLGGGRRVEITAARDVRVASRIANKAPARTDQAAALAGRVAPASPLGAYRAAARDDVSASFSQLNTMAEDLARRGDRLHDVPQALFKLFTDLIEADVSDELARELIQRVQSDVSGDDLGDLMLVKARIARMIEDEIRTTGPIRVAPGGRRVVALVGPTGVGKTTTIAKLAANYRLREKRRVGLVTVDTYRIAAVEQMRTYADIMDLPMEVVSTPREMREAVNRLSGLDLIFMDTAGRSPKDELKIQELKSMLAEAAADEVHLVLSSVASASSLISTAKQFAQVGTTALVLTKLDEATGLGNLLPLVRGTQLPLSYLTDGQNVPDDIQVADPRRLARVVLGMET